MEPVVRENRVLRILVVVLFAAFAVDDVMSGQDQGQRLPGPGSGVVPVRVTDEARVAQHGDWKVAQQGDWKVGVQGSVATTPVMPPFLAVNRTYSVYWAHETAEQLVVRELHPSGWARVDVRGRERWVNLTQAIAILTLGS